MSFSYRSAAFSRSADANAAAARRPAPFGPELIAISLDVLRAWDVAALVATGLLANAFYLWLAHFRLQTDYARFILGAALTAPVVLHWTGVYRYEGRIPRAADLRPAALGAVCVFASALLLGFLFKTEVTISRIWMASWFTLFLVSVFASRSAMILTLRYLAGRGLLRDRVAVVGATPLAAEVVEHLGERSSHLIEVVGVFDDRRAERGEAGLPPVAGSVDDLIRLGQSQRLSHVILALPWAAEARLESLLHRLKTLSVDVTVCADETAVRLVERSVDVFGGWPALRLAERPLKSWTLVLKQLEDWLIGAALILMAAPVLLAVAVAVRLDSPGPILFRQRRHGYNNREITVYKFRTLPAGAGDASGGRQTEVDDPRITRLGRWLRASSLDELPQLFNVLKGDMSLVGPRPHPVGMRTETLLGADVVSTYTHRHRVKPGLTGWAQVHGYRGATASREALARRVQYDLDYIDRCSLLLDLHILLITPLSVLSRKNAF